jgi:uncharacterized membrane protein YfcA
MEILTLIVMGGLAGVMAGLLGIGGGALIVPVLVFVFEAQRVNPDIIMQVALGTSMATIVFTAMSSVLAHQRRGAVRWSIFRRITPGIVIGSFAGAAIVHVLASRTLRVMFVVFMFLLAIQMARGTMATSAHRRRFPGAAVTGAVGVVIGVLSAFFGIGGGSMSVPFMTWNGVPAREAIGAAALELGLRGAAGVRRHRGGEHGGGAVRRAPGPPVVGEDAAAHLRAVRGDPRDAHAVDNTIRSFNHALRPS